MRRSLPAIGAVFAVLLTLTGGCGQDREAPPPRTRMAVQVAPVTSIVPTGDAPDPVTDICAECERKLRARQNAALARRMSQVAGGTPPDVEAVATLCAGVAKINLRRYAEGLRDLNRAERARAAFPGEVTEPLLELLYRAEMVGYASVGDRSAATRSWARLQQVSPAHADRFRRELCAAAVEPRSIPVCSGAPPRPAPGTPTGSPAPEDTVTRSPDTDVPETDAPETDAPDTEAPDTEAPETDVPDTDGPGTDGPGTDGPGTGEPGTEAPGTDEPEPDTPEGERPGVSPPRS